MMEQIVGIVGGSERGCDLVFTPHVCVLPSVDNYSRCKLSACGCFPSSQARRAKAPSLIPCDLFHRFPFGGPHIDYGLDNHHSTVECHDYACDPNPRISLKHQCAGNGRQADSEWALQSPMPISSPVVGISTDIRVSVHQ